MSLRKSSLARAFPALGAAAILAAAAGCGGHGKYTTEGISNAELRLGQIKAGTQWDLAHHQFLVGDLKKALDSVNSSIAHNGDVAKSHTLRGRILVELGQLEPAVEAFERALAIDVSFVDAHYYLGMVFERFRKLETAFEKYETAGNLDPSNPQYLIAAAEMLIEMGKLDQAEALLEERRSTFQHNAGVRQTLGHIAMMRNKPHEAVRCFEEARLLAPDEPSLLEDLALAQIGAGRFAEAEYTLRRLLSNQSSAGRRDLMHAQARCLIELDRPVEARSILLGLTSDEQGKNDVQAWADLGEVALLLGDMHRVRIVGLRLVSLAPSQAEGHLLLAAWKRKNNDLEGALTSLASAADCAPTNATVAMMRGLVLSELGRHIDAAESFSRALALDPDSAVAKKVFATVNPNED